MNVIEPAGAPHSNLRLTEVAAIGLGGAALGVAAMVGRKLMVQAPTALAGDWDKALAAEHAAVAKLFESLEGTTDAQKAKRTRLLTQLKHSLGKHALQEENVIYPALREAGQIEDADQLNTEHGYVKQFLYDLENMANDDPAFLSKVREFRMHIEKHVREEEDELFPKLKAKLDDYQNRKLTRTMNKEGLKLA